MIVVAIIAILAAIAIPAYQDYTIRSQVSEGPVLADGAKTAVAEFYQNTGRFPHNNTSAGLAKDTSISGQYVTKITVAGDDAGATITATYGGPKASKKIDTTAQLQLSPVTSAGSITWVCKPVGSSIKPNYLPQNCRK